MNPEEYAAQQALITAAAANYALQFGGFLIRPGMGIPEWIQLLRVLYPEVEQRRTESAILARDFYDSQRRLYVPDLPRNDVLLEGNSFETFVKSMDPVRKTVLQAARVDPIQNLDTPATPAQQVVDLLKNPRQQNAAVTRLALQTIREVENAGRRQVIHSVQQDEILAEVVRAQPATVEQPKAEPTILDYKGKPVKETSSLIRGWARVATGRETCAWCLMLISRGPVYLGADTAGLRLDDASAVSMIAAGEDVSEYMEDWHAGCDCKVVPVFKISEWTGRDAWKRAEELWKDATKEAQALRREADDPLVYRQGQNKGGTRSLNHEVINALRRRLNSGEIDMSEFAALAA